MRAWLLLVALFCSLAAQAAPITVDGVDAYGRRFGLDQARGRVVAIDLVSRYTRKELEQVNNVLQPWVGRDVEVVTVVDFIGIPHLFHNYARRKVREGTTRSPIQFLVDDHGRWRSALGARPDKRVDILVLDRNGEVRGHFVGKQQLGAALRLISELRDESPSAIAPTPAAP